MKRIKIRPRLVDHSLFQPTPSIKPTPKRIVPAIEPSSQSNDLSRWFNAIGFVVLAIGGVYLYQRYINREQILAVKQHSIIHLNQRVREHLQSNAHFNQTPQQASKTPNTQKTPQQTRPSMIPAQ
jgi:hypothetical protein